MGAKDEKKIKNIRNIRVGLMKITRSGGSFRDTFFLFFLNCGMSGKFRKLHGTFWCKNYGRLFVSIFILRVRSAFFLLFINMGVINFRRRIFISYDSFFLVSNVFTSSFAYQKLLMPTTAFACIKLISIKLKLTKYKHTYCGSEKYYQQKKSSPN